MEIIVGIIIFLLGYLVGRVDLIYKIVKKKEQIVERPVVFTTKLSENISNNRIKNNNTPSFKSPNITIDESKFVTTIKTDSFEKDFKSLGETSVSKDNINSSISKLSQLKKNKE